LRLRLHARMLKSRAMHHPKLVFLLAAFGFAIARYSGATMLSVSVEPASATYDTTVEDIDLRVTLHLDAAASGSVTVCTFDGGVLQFTGVSRNGVHLEPKRYAFVPLEPFSLFQSRSLVTLQPGESATMPLRLMRRGDDSVELQEVFERADVYPGEALTWTLPVPGKYRFRVVYEYTGPDGGHADIFRERVTSSTVTLVLLQ
jgi:hypothetical protein